MLDDLTERELALVDAAHGGTVLECSDHGVDVLASSTDPGLRVRAAVVRELLLGRCGGVDPRGVRIRGARIVGALDLEHVTAVARLVLIECVLDRVNLSRTVLPQLVLTGSRAAAINADGIQVDGDLLLSQTRISGTGAMGALCLPNARITGILDLQEAEVSNDSGPALHATSLHADGVILRQARMTGTGDRGTIRMSDAHVRGVLNMDGAQVRNHSGPALHADRLRVDSLLFLREVRLTGHGDRGTARLQGARVGGAVNLQSAELRNDSGAALDAADLEVGGTLCLERMRVSGTGKSGAICLASARLGDSLYLVDTTVDNESGPALHADSLHTEDTIVLLETRLSGTSDGGTIWLLGAHVGGLRWSARKPPTTSAPRCSPISCRSGDTHTSSRYGCQVPECTPPSAWPSPASAASSRSPVRRSATRPGACGPARHRCGRRRPRLRRCHLS